MKKVFKVAHIRDLEKQVIQEQISYSRMVEIMNEMAHKAYTKVEKLPIHSVSNSLLDLDGKTIPITFHVSKYKPKIDIDLDNDC